MISRRDVQIVLDHPRRAARARRRGWPDRRRPPGELRELARHGGHEVRRQRGKRPSSAERVPGSSGKAAAITASTTASARAGMHLARARARPSRGGRSTTLHLARGARRSAPRPASPASARSRSRGSPRSRRAARPTRGRGARASRPSSRRSLTPRTVTRSCARRKPMSSRAAESFTSGATNWPIAAGEVPGASAATGSSGSGSTRGAG